jgi:cytochrome P450
MVMAYHLLQNPPARRRLEAELREAWPVLDEVPSYEVLEKLPYLVRDASLNAMSLPNDTRRRIAFSPGFPDEHSSPSLSLFVQAAVAKEGLRMFPGVIAHPRVVPRKGAVISGTFIPGGVGFFFRPFFHPLHSLLDAIFFSHTARTQTVVGQSFCYVHRSPLMYERPEAFLPERWLGPDSKACDAALSAFSKGPRACFGVNLAYAELHLGIANVFRRFDLCLDEAR